MLIANNITKSYGNTNVLQGIDLTINNKEVVCIMGTSGAGKSTLMHILSTLEQPDTGNLFFNETNLLKLNKNDLAIFRNKNIGFVFQSYNLLSELNVIENVCIPGYIGNFKHDLVQKKAIELLNTLNLGHKIKANILELSGGEKQRVAVARALINDPEMVFADEPCGNLDSMNAKNMYDLLLSLHRQLGKTLVVSTHNKDFFEMADKKLFIKDGKIS